MGTDMTSYRITSDGSVFFLQYLRENWFSSFVLKTWVDVPIPYCDKKLGAFSTVRTDTSIHADSEGILEAFTERWPNIADYMIRYHSEQKRMEEERNRYWSEKEDQSKKAVNL